MKSNVHRRRARNSGVILILACFCMPVLIGLMGLAVDASVLYAVKTRLQLACDGAALAGLRSMSLSQSSSGQTSAVTTVATQWFNANFAGNYLGVSGTTGPTVAIGNANSTHSVTVSATTNAPSYFMKFWNRGATAIYASGQAGRRNVNLMMVLDRSGSMDPSWSGSGSPTANSPCAQMITAAKQFTGMFTPLQDSIGLLTFAETAYIAASPNTAFQTQLGYTNTNGSQAGYLDQITCQGGTNTSTGISLAWNELYKKQLPGAFNVILLLTDGNPTAASFNFKSVISGSSSCKDSTGLAISSGGNMVTHPQNWISSSGEGNSGSTVSLGANSYWSALSGPIGGLYGDGSGLYGVSHFFAPANSSITGYESSGTFHKSSTESPGCSFTSNGSYGSPTSDIASVPSQDLFGITTSGYQTSGTTVSATNVGKVVINLADNAANWARNPVSGGNLINYTNGVQTAQTTFFVIGLGGNGGVDYALLQRIANDPSADPSGSNLWATYTPVSGQPQGKFIYSPTASQISTAFTLLGSSTLRLAQ